MPSFAATAAVIIRGRHLFDANDWEAWRRAIADTMQKTTRRDGDRVNWPAFVYPENRIIYPEKRLMQVCHGAPGIVMRRKVMSSIFGRLFSSKGARRRRMPTFTRMRGSSAKMRYM